MKNSKRLGLVRIGGKKKLICVHQDTLEVRMFPAGVVWSHGAAGGGPGRGHQARTVDWEEKSADEKHWSILVIVCLVPVHNVQCTMY